MGEQYTLFGASLMAPLVKNPPAMQETCVQSLGWEYPREKGKATHSSILAWRIPWTIQSMGSQRVRHNFHFHTPPFPFDNHKFVFDRERQISYDTIYMWNLKNDNK